jgi:hypothetical protein
MRGYFEEVVRWAFATDADIGSTESRRLRNVVEDFVSSVGAMLGVDRNSTLAQVLTAQQAGRTHCDLLVNADDMFDLTTILLDFLGAVEDLRSRGPMLAPAPPPGVRAFVLACQEGLQHQAAPSAPPFGHGSRASTRSACCEGSPSPGVSTNSGDDGGSYGLSMPVKPRSSPARAFL